MFIAAIIYPTQCKTNLRIILPVESFIRKLINYDNIQKKRDNKANNNNNNNINIKKSVLTRQEPDTPKSKKKICINQARAEDTPNSFFGVHVSCDLRIFG